MYNETFQTDLTEKKINGDLDVIFKPKSTA